jgi:hypothetical protein
MIPIVGPILSAVPAIAVALSVTPTLALGVLCSSSRQQQLENHLLVPKIMQRQVGISPVFIIIALLIGGSLLGVMGAILAVPTAAILQVLLERTLTDPLNDPSTAFAAGPSSTFGARTRRRLRDVCLHRYHRCDDVAARRSSHARRRVGSWRLGAQHVDPRVGLRAAARHPAGPLFTSAALLRRQHLSSGAADARVFGTSDSPGRPDLSDLRRDEEPNPLLQPAVPLYR